ncbi:hypothetical protein [Arthrobacter jiangjiafuii]|uniref:hypothetical protein n=1 Tax=Arthrobacter jiangjiafuii TaxID=2817475 RepID=UPI001F3710C9|nr:hypothetical protein [Arthrobacter jiangjiafuii]
MGKNSKLMSVATVSALALALVSCSGEKPSPQDAAASLAEGLARLDVSASAFTAGTASDANTELERIMEGMGALRPDVSVAGVETDQEDHRNRPARLCLGPQRRLGG